MDQSELLDLVAYTEWATAQVTAALRLVPDADRRRRDDSAFGSLHGTFAHLIAAEWVWLERWKGTSSAAPPEWVRESGFDGLVEHLRLIEQERARLLRALDAEARSRPMSYRTFAGQEQSNPIGDLVRHVVNHGTYHRGQISMRIRQLGHTPPGTDYIVWLRLPAAERASRS